MRHERRRDGHFDRLVGAVIAACWLFGSQGVGGLACGGNAASPGSRLESNTNWLRMCASDADCAGGLSCMCGMCSLACEASSACGSLRDATCRSSCGTAPAPAMCVLACSASSDCGPGFECFASACRPLQGADATPAPAESPDESAATEEAALPPLGDLESATAGPCSNAFISIDSLYSLALADLAEQSESAQPYTRYVSLANRVNAGACAPDLDSLRSGVTLALNSTSRASRLGTPRAIDSGSVLHRIDLRDYAWDRRVSVQGVEFDDAWDALTANTPFAVELVGPEASDLETRTTAAVPILSADALISVVIDGETYGALLGLPETLEALFSALQVDTQTNRQNGAAQRAGTLDSLLSKRDRVLERQPFGPTTPGVWMTFEFPSDALSSELLADPIDMSAAMGGTVIFPLPNGLPAFAIFDSERRLATTSDLLLDFNMSGFHVRAAVSCMGCHNTGLVGAEDQVRSWVEANPDLYAAAQRSSVEMLYPPERDWTALRAADNALYREAKLGLGIESASAPAWRSFLNFANDLTTADQAGDLMLPRALAAAQLGESGELVDRAEFGVNFPEKMCAGLGSARNTPRVCAAP